MVKFISPMLLLMAFAACAGELPAPCDTLTLAQLQNSCRYKVRAACKRDPKTDQVDESCPTLIECSKRLKAWHACAGAGGADAGSELGAAGAP